MVQVQLESGCRWCGGASFVLTIASTYTAYAPSTYTRLSLALSQCIAVQKHILFVLNVCNLFSAANYWIRPNSPVACDFQSAVMQVFEVCGAFTWTCFFQVR